MCPACIATAAWRPPALRRRAGEAECFSAERAHREVRTGLFGGAGQRSQKDRARREEASRDDRCEDNTISIWIKKDEITKGKVYYNYQTQSFQSEELSGISLFSIGMRGDIFHTYSTYARGDELLDGAYNYLDLTPKGRNETGPNHNLMDWVRHHAGYDD